MVGVSLRTQAGESRCCEIDDARESAMKIGIPFYVHLFLTLFLVVENAMVPGEKENAELDLSLIEKMNL